MADHANEPAGTATAWPGRRPRPPLIWAITLSGITANTLIAPVLPDILAEFDRGDTAAGVVVAAASLPGVVAAPVIGVLADRRGRRRVVVGCLVLFGLASLVAAAAPTFEVLVAARFVMGCGGAGLINLSVVLIGDHWDGQERVREVGRNAAVLTGGLAVLPPLAGALAALGSWRLSQVPSAIALVAAWAAWVELDDVAPPHAASSLRHQLGDASRTLRRPVMAATIVAGFLIFVMIFGLFLTVLPVHLESAFGVDAAGRGLLLAVPAIGSTLVSLNLARLRRMVGLRLLLIAGALAFGISLVLIGWIASLIGVVISLVLYGVAEGCTVPSLQEVTAARAPAAQRGTVLAVWVAAVRLGQSVGPLTFAALSASIGTSASLIAGALVAVPVLALFMFTSIGTAPEPSP